MAEKKKARKRKAVLLPEHRVPAILPRVGTMLSRLAKIFAGTHTNSIIQFIQRLLLRLPLVPHLVNRLNTMLPPNLLWPTQEPYQLKATIHIIRSADTIVDLWVWARDQPVLWTHGSFGKGILSRSEATWTKRYLQQTQQGEDKREYLEEITRKRRQERNPTAEQTYVEMGELDIGEGEAEAMEPVQLSPCETLFLVETGYLTVSDADGKGYGLRELWQLYGLVESNLPMLYAAYHYYRSKGWIVRSGCKFAADFLLYRKGPAWSHSEYAVVVRPLSEHSSEEQEHHALADSWQYMFAVSRVTNQVKKALLICFVKCPKHFEYPPDLRQFQIMETTVQRFDPNINRN